MTLIKNIPSSSLFFACISLPQINTALAELTSAVKDVCAFHRGESASTTPSFLFTVPQEAYHAAEDSYLTELTAFTRKQFFQVSQIAHRVIMRFEQLAQIDL